MADPVIVEAKFRRKVTLPSGTTVIPGDLLYWDGTNHDLADADSASTYAQLVALEYGDGDGVIANATIEAAPYAVIYDSDAPFTVDAQQYLSTTAGDFTETAPSGAGDLVQVVGVAHTTELVEISIQPPKEVTVTLGKPFMLNTAADLVQDTGPAAGTVLAAANDAGVYVWFTPRNCVGIQRAILGWSANIELDASDTYSVSVSSAGDGQANDATTDSIGATALTVTADDVTEDSILAALNAAGIPTPGEWVHIDINKDAEGAGGDDPVLYSVAITYLAV